MKDSKRNIKVDCTVGNNQEMAQGPCVSTRRVEQFH